MLENKALSRGIIGKSAPILAEITIRKSQLPFLYVAFLYWRVFFDVFFFEDALDRKGG